MKIAVVGAGISGLTCAHQLQKSGHDVTVFERNDYVGGRMSTHYIDGMGFDRGANFYVKNYKDTLAYHIELGIKEKWQPMIAGTHVTFRHGKFGLLALKNIWAIFRFNSLSPWGRIRLLIFFIVIGRRIKDLDFYNLEEATKYDTTNAYDYAKKWAGKEVADYVIDGFASTYQFHSAREISLGALLGLMSSMSSDRSGFRLHHTIGGMSVIPEEIAKLLDVRLAMPVSKVVAVDDGVVLHTDDLEEKFDLVVMASTGDITKLIYSNPSEKQKAFLDKVKYATSINLSFKIPSDILGMYSIGTIAEVESSLISNFCHEKMKGIDQEGKTLLSVGLHEKGAIKIFDKPDEKIYEIVKKELLRLLEQFNGDMSLIENNDIKKWPAVMPKFYHGHLKNVQKFLKDGQGDKNVYFCGDYLNSPWIEGSIGCGKRVAEQISRSVVTPI